jgi:hypothetical protein
MVVPGRGRLRLPASHHGPDKLSTPRGCDEGLPQAGIDSTARREVLAAFHPGR